MIVGRRADRPEVGGGGGVPPSKRVMGMCRWMGSHFHIWIDYKGVTFLVELLGWGRTSSRFLGQENSGKQGFKNRKIRSQKMIKMGSMISYRIDHNG